MIDISGIILDINRGANGHPAKLVAGGSVCKVLTALTGIAAPLTEMLVFASSDFRFNVFVPGPGQ